MTNVFNGTAHPINIIQGAVFNADLRKYTGGEVVASISVDKMLNAVIDTVSVGTINGNIPKFEKRIVDSDQVPEGYEVIIVSQLFASAVRMYKSTANLYTVADPVYSEDGRTILGCMGICPVF